VPPKIVVNHPYYRMMFDFETYALDNKSVVYTRRQARTLGRRKKDVAQSFGVRDEWDGSPPAKVFQFLRKFAKACDDNGISEDEAFYILQDFMKEPLKSEVMMVMPTCQAGNPGEVTSYLELINWMVRRHVDESSVATLVETPNVAVQRDDDDKLSFAERLRRLSTEFGLMYGEGALQGGFVEGVHRAARATVRERNTLGMTMVELARLRATSTAGYDSSSLRSGPRSEKCLRKRPGSGGKLARPHFPGSQREHGVTHRRTPPFGSSGPWTPLLLAPGTMRSDPGHRTARLLGAATSHATGLDRGMSRPDTNPRRESTLAGSVAR